ncbi:hypothetical protein ACU686_14490 [Yinghuangia aomiensis]
MSLVVDTGEARALWSRTAERLAAALSGSGRAPRRRRPRVARGGGFGRGGRHGAGRSGPGGAPHDGPGTWSWCSATCIAATGATGPRCGSSPAGRTTYRWPSSICCPSTCGPVCPWCLNAPCCTARHRAAANRHWSCRDDPFGLLARDPDADGPGRPDPHHMPVPVLELTPEALSGWARFVRRDDAAGYAAKAVLVSPAAPAVRSPRRSATRRRRPTTSAASRRN